MKHPIQGLQKLELIDGMGKQLARMIKSGIEALDTQCAEGRHCAHHGNDPFVCCLCGAEFTPADEHGE